MLEMKIPQAEFKTLSSEGIKSLSSSEIFDGKNVLVVGVIGAFTPVCTKQHLPNFIPYANQLMENNIVDSVVCISVADPFVLKAWSDSLKVGKSILMLTDTNANFARALGLEQDLSHVGLGIRSKRYVMLAKESVISMLQVEEKTDQLQVTSQEAIESVIGRYL